MATPIQLADYGHVILKKGFIHEWAYIYGRHLVLVIFIVTVNYNVNERKYELTVYINIIKQVG